MTKRDGRALWRALQDQEAQDDFDEIMAMSDDEVDAYIAANGGDPKAIRASGVALGKELSARAERLGWHDDMANKAKGYRDLAEQKRQRPRLSREELLARIEAARNDARFSTPIAAMFHDKKPEASTDEELRAMLDQIELLAKLDEEEGK